jgi:hypothetical protein
MHYREKECIGMFICRESPEAENAEARGGIRLRTAMHSNLWSTRVLRYADRRGNANRPEKVSRKISNDGSPPKSDQARSS